MTDIELIDAQEILDSRGNPTLEVVVVARRRRAWAARPSRPAPRPVPTRPSSCATARRAATAARACARPWSTSSRSSRRRCIDQDAADQARRRPAAHRPRRHAQQGRAGRQRDPRRLACLRPCRRGGLRPAALPLPGRRRRAHPARAHVQHPQRRQARPRLDRLPGVHGHARRGTDLQRGAARRAPRSSTRCAQELHDRATRPDRATRAASRRRWPRTQAAIEVVLKAIERAGYTPGEEVVIALDPAITRAGRPGHADDRTAS